MYLKRIINFGKPRLVAGSFTCTDVAVSINMLMVENANEKTALQKM
jgi:hypothetical protein